MAHAWIRPDVQLADTPVADKGQPRRLCHGPSTSGKRLPFRKGNTGKTCQKNNWFFLRVQWCMYVRPELIWPMIQVFSAVSSNEFPLWINASNISFLILERHWALQSLHKETIQGITRCSVPKQLEHGKAKFCVLSFKQHWSLAEILRAKFQLKGNFFGYSISPGE